MISNVDNNIFVDRYDFGTNLKYELYDRDNDPFNISTYAVSIIIKKKKSADDSTAIYSHTFTAGSFTSNVINIPVAQNMTSSAAGTYFYAIRISKASFVSTIVQANWTINENSFNEAVA